MQADAFCSGVLGESIVPYTLCVHPNPIDHSAVFWGNGEDIVAHSNAAEKKQKKRLSGATISIFLEARASACRAFFVANGIARAQQIKMLTSYFIFKMCLYNFSYIPEPTVNFRHDFLLLQKRRKTSSNCGALTNGDLGGNGVPLPTTGDE